MVILRITFLLAFPLKVENSREIPQTKTNKKAKTVSKTSKIPKKATNAVMDAISKPDYVIETEEPTGYANISYNLYPNEKKYYVDVVCWEKMAKIFCEDSSRYFTTIVTADRVWLPICLQHARPALDTEDLFSFHKHMITCTIKLGKRALTENYVTEKRDYYLKKEDVGHTDIVEVFDVDPNVEGIDSLHVKRKNISSKLNKKKKVDNQCSSCILYPDEVHYCRMKHVIELVSSNKEVNVFPNVPSPEYCEEDEEEIIEERTLGDVLRKRLKENSYVNKKTSKANSTRILSKSSSINMFQATKGERVNIKNAMRQDQDKKARAKVVDTHFEFNFPAEIFISDPQFAIFKFSTDARWLLNAFVFTSSQQVVSLSQQIELNPLVIKLRGITGLPVEILKKHGFHSIYLKYIEKDVFYCKSELKPISEEIHFNVSNVFFTYSYPDRINEVISKKGMVIEVIGVRDKLPEFNPSLFGTEYEDTALMRRGITTFMFSRITETVRRPLEVCLCVCNVSLTSLFLSAMYNKMCISCTVPLYNCTLQTELEKQILNILNFKEIFERQSFSPLTGGVLLDYNTSLKVEIYLMMPQLVKVKNSFRNLIDYYEETIIISPNFESMKFLHNFTFFHNLRVLKKFPPTQNFFEPGLDDLNVATGFFFNDGVNNILYLESRCDGICRILRQKAEFLEDPDMRIMWGSNYYSLRRKFKECIPIKGILKVILVKSLQSLMSSSRTFIVGNASPACLSAMSKLDLILRSSTLRQINQSNLIPSPQELLALAVEFGVPTQASKYFKNVGKSNKNGNTVDFL